MPQQTQHYEAASVTQALALIWAKDDALIAEQTGGSGVGRIDQFGNGGEAGFGPEHFGIGPDRAA